MSALGERAMTGKVGDRISVDGKKGPARVGEILEVVPSSLGDRYRVRWNDGHETEIRPHGGSVTITPAGSADHDAPEGTTRRVDPADFPAPRTGFVITQFLVVSDQDRSRAFYQRLFDGTVVLERDPVIIKVANTWLILNEGGGPTDDKPTVTLTTPPDPDRSSAFLNVRVADMAKLYAEWSAKGVEFLTEPVDHGREIRAYVRDPDGHLIEIGQATGVLERA
jgi:catechol 2,3-dioxygenase-like lactoylglutathione lyase family enzyme